ncbi:MAG: type II toxin-antitoxin system RelE/ParE family toxin [Actinobacteria bacterium]|nr:type II toxin-antitoxin system RelE/ParE family toxin [Actinomycetota bacterium]
MENNKIYNIEFSPKSLKDLEKFSVSTQKKIVENLNDLKKNFHGTFLTKIKRLKSFEESIYRYRVENYRVIFTFIENKIVILRIIDRKELEKIIKNFVKENYY